ncbi:diguanylate cyclase [Eubacteriaceae bacterium ES3]|nr:diguanylate cyclase [Eubacteriaceae bacterium ES3]
MKNLFDKSHSILLLGLGLTIIWLVLLVYFQTLYENRYQEYLNQREERFEDELESILNAYESFSNYIFETMIDHDSIYEIMIQAASSDDGQKAMLREQLQQSLSDDYQVISGHGFNQMQFHLPDGTSFLRFHAPDQFGDDLKLKRGSLEIVAQTHQPVSGFEVGEFFTGYRFIYPFMKDENFIGSVETSIPMGKVISGLYSLEPMQDYGFLLNKELMETIASEDIQVQYQDSLISNDYVSDIEVFEITKANSGILEIYSDPEFLKMMKAAVVSKIKTGESFTVSISYKGKYYIVQFEQIKDISGQQAGYIYIAGENSQLFDLARTRDLSFLLTTIVYFVLLLVIYYIKQRNDMIAKLAIYDQLTEIYNRYAFFELSKKMLEAANRSKCPVCLAILDIDFFKRVNDLYGHQTGDIVLRTLAGIVAESVRKSDVLARFGGEELILLMPESSLSDSWEVAERIRKAIESYSFAAVGQITVSIGLVEMDFEEDLNDAIIRADQALYAAKENGRNKTVAR